MLVFLVAFEYLIYKKNPQIAGSYKNSYHSNSSYDPSRSSHQRCSKKEGVLKNLAKFTGKHLYQSLFFNNKVAG